MKEILDHSQKEEVFQEFRLLPILIEAVPILISLLGVILSNERITTVGFCSLSLIYLTLSWYLFKSNKFAVLDIIATVIFGTGLSVILLGMLFGIQNWEGFDLMLIVSHTTLFVCLPLALIFMAIKMMIVKNKRFERRMSLKILSRFILLIIIFYALDMNVPMDELFERSSS